MDDKFTLVIVPTAGFEGAPGSLQPSQNGRRRLRVAAIFLKDIPHMRLAICGGARGNQDHSEAIVAERWFSMTYPELSSRVYLVDARSKYTAGDMVSLVERLKGSLKMIENIIIVTHPNHGRLAAKTLSNAMGRSDIIIATEPSGEPAPYSPLKQTILDFITDRDPLWKRFWSWPLRLLANRRGRNE